MSKPAACWLVCRLLDMAKIRFGVIGCGYIAKKAFIPALKKSRYAELVAVASRDKNKAKSFSIEFGCNYEKDYETLLSRDDLDAVYIATIPSTHEEIILMSANYGKHILCEKPLTVSYNSAKKIVDNCKNSGVGVFEGFMYQFHSQHKRVRDLVDNGDIGKPILFTASFGIPKLDENNYRNKLNLGGGACLDVGSYTIHAARHFFNREPIDIQHITYNDGEEVDMHSVVTLDFGDNQTAQLSFGFNNYYRNTYSIWGTKGQATVIRAFSIPPNMKAKIIIEKQDYYKEIICDANDQFELEIDYFCKMFSNKTKASSWNDEILYQSMIIDKIINH